MSRALHPDLPTLLLHLCSPHLASLAGFWPSYASFPCTMGSIALATSDTQAPFERNLRVLHRDRVRTSNELTQQTLHTITRLRAPTNPSPLGATTTDAAPSTDHLPCSAHSHLHFPNTNPFRAHPGVTPHASAPAPVPAAIETSPPLDHTADSCI